jgi:hypothetical protein
MTKEPNSFRARVTWRRPHLKKVLVLIYHVLLSTGGGAFAQVQFRPVVTLLTQLPGPTATKDNQWSSQTLQVNQPIPDNQQSGINSEGTTTDYFNEGTPNSNDSWRGKPVRTWSPGKCRLTKRMERRKPQRFAMVQGSLPELAVLSGQVSQRGNRGGLSDFPSPQS